MEQTKIIKLSTLQEPQINQITELLVESFYSMFKGISKDREILQKLFAPCLQTDLFYVLFEKDTPAGFVAVSDSEKRAVMIDQDVCISIFGPAKGKMLTLQLRKILCVPAVTGTDMGYIDFIATAQEFRGKGIATALLTFVEANTDFNCLYLDVLESNTPAIRLYEKQGFQAESVKKNLWMRLAGIKAMHIMKKVLNGKDLK